MTQSDDRAREIAHWQVLTFRARSFRWASAFLSQAQRLRVAALYAFCRAVDDLADAEAYLAKFGDKVPERLKAQLEAQKARLG